MFTDQAAMRSPWRTFADNLNLVGRFVEIKLRR